MVTDKFREYRFLPDDPYSRYYVFAEFSCPDPSTVSHANGINISYVMESAMLTPQAIKDQDFQIKFRGYDAIEVKAYLELLAEDFFELTEQNRIYEGETESLKTELELLQREKDSLAAEVRLSQENAEGIQSQIDQDKKHKDKEISDMMVLVEETRASALALEVENRDLQNKVQELEEKLAGGGGEEEHGPH